MGNANAGGWGYTARYGWNRRSARAISGALGSLALPMPPWLRAVVSRCLLTRIALHADAEGIRGSAGPRLTGTRVGGAAPGARRRGSTLGFGGAGSLPGRCASGPGGPLDVNWLDLGHRLLGTTYPWGERNRRR